MDRFGLGGHVAIGVEIAVERLTGRDPVDHFDAADFDEPVTGLGIEAGRFGVEDNLAHYIKDIGPIRPSGKGATRYFFAAVSA